MKLIHAFMLFGLILLPVFSSSCRRGVIDSRTEKILESIAFKQPGGQISQHLIAKDFWLFAITDPKTEGEAALALIAQNQPVMVIKKVSNGKTITIFENSLPALLCAIDDTVQSKEHITVMRHTGSELDKTFLIYGDNGEIVERKTIERTK